MSATSLPLVAHSRPTDLGAAARWAGRALTALVILFLCFDVSTKLFAVKAAVDGAKQMGFAPQLIPIIGAIGLVCLVLYVIPRTAPLGALLWTAYFGGAVATNLRMQLPLFSYTLAPVYVAAAVWGALYLRDARVRAFVRSLVRPER